MEDFPGSVLDVDNVEEVSREWSITVELVRESKVQFAMADLSIRGWEDHVGGWTVKEVMVLERALGIVEP